MPCTQPCDDYPDAYDAWLVVHRAAYLSEVQAIRHLLTSRTSCLEIGIGSRGVKMNQIQEPVNINLFSISLAFGLLIKINFVSVLAVIFVIIYFKWWYL